MKKRREKQVTEDEAKKVRDRAGKEGDSSKYIRHLLSLTDSWRPKEPRVLLGALGIGEIRCPTEILSQNAVWVL